MINALSHVNWLAVLVASAAHFILGGIWFAALVGDHYAAALGHAKPAPEFYREIEARTGFAPSELFFIDDKAANVQAAQGCGWAAAVWTGQERLADLMAKAGF